jgi:cell filamentation protein
VSWDPYLDLEAGVLRNRLGITDRDELARVEASLTASRLYDLHRAPLAGAYDLAHLRAFHRHIFADVYDWAGELRTVSIGKGTLFCLPQHLLAAGADLFGRLARADHLRGLARPDFVDALTELSADINALHPFREGNGRAQRAFLAQLARDAGHPIRWSVMEPTANVEASRTAHRGDNTLLRAMLDELVHRPQDGPDTSPAGPPLPRRPGDDKPP